MRKAPGLTLSNTTDIVANKISLIQGNTTTDILDLISNAAGNVDSYTRTESDARYYTQSQVNTSLALKVDNTTLTNDYMPTTQLNSVLALKVNTSTLSQYYTQTQADTLLNSKQNFVISANSTGSGIPLLSAPQGALDNVVKTISVQSGLTLTDVLDLTTTPVDRRLDFGIDSSVVALQTDITNVNTNLTNNYLTSTQIGAAYATLQYLNNTFMTTANIQSNLANYMLTTDVNNALALKLDTTTFNNDIANYMLTADVNTALGLKLDSSLFNSTIANYMLSSDITTALAAKQDTLYAGSFSGTSLLQYLSTGAYLKNISVGSGLTLTNVSTTTTPYDLRVDIDLSSTNSDKLDVILHSGNFNYIGFKNSLSTTANVFSFNHYTNINHNGSVQKFWGSSNSNTLVMEISQYSSNVTAPNGSFVSNSDITLKDNVTDIDNNECIRLLETISPKTYTRNDLNNEKRVGFISNEFDNELNDDMKNIIGSLKDDEGNHLTTTLDYARLTTILWGVCQQLNERIKALEG